MLYIINDQPHTRPYIDIGGGWFRFITTFTTPFKVRMAKRSLRRVCCGQLLSASMSSSNFATVLPLCYSLSDTVGKANEAN